MAVLRKARRERYTIIDNEVFCNTALSLKAKGLLCQMLSLPDGWEYSIEGLAQLCSDGRTSVASAVKELEEAGYIRRIQVREGGKVAGIEYVVYESPIADLPKAENLISENLISENLRAENREQLNTKELNTKELNTKSYRFTPPAREEVQAYIMEQGYSVDAERFVDYYTSNGWMVGRTKMKDWRAAVRTWQKKTRDAPRQDRPRDFNDFL